MRRRSRLNKSQEKKQRKTIMLSILGIIVILFMLVTFGITALINFSLFLSGNDTTKQQIKQNEVSFVLAPILNPLPSATNSAQISVSGTSQKDTAVVLYINNDLIDKTDLDEKGRYEFIPKLKKGENVIKTRAIIKDKKSDFSNSYTVLFINSEPKLEVSNPSDNQSFNKDQNKVNVAGKTDPGVNITVNGFWAVIDENNNFSYALTLHDGDNDIKIVAIDQAGNKFEKNLRVKYSQ